MGGFGLRALLHIAPAAFLASLAAIASSIAFPPPRSLLLDIHHALSFIAPGSQLPKAEDFLPFFLDCNSRGLQRAL